ncbi:hypothetical protein [Vibrio parahaemolyticus]|uniref:hypothetical protein n=1 Tax=Vibrio parahaemolyticus TaxID=670 RepID=UPI0009A934F6|nr:hypothetical protein [Vibrio parahaemolyticus]ASO17428.1 hypothetical protein BGM07_025030 [Vibrio parahaemolyticus]AWA90733.1 hypothetical protein BSG32_02630 [Vibrio parahaemolyticus]EGQ8683738.1 hypothetical protein [Vibrio parahaemolyticus]EGQ8781347.1 hypothetical protein [Vibrio parahaemolyticus]EGQ8830282.1 hypothetical protein [Vibrio parahaemolyticus]
MRSLTKLDRAMQIKRIEGKAALEQCLLDKQTLKFTSNRFVQENPRTALGLSAFAAIAVAKAGRLSRVTSSLSSISLLLNGAMDLSGQLAKSSSSSAASSKEAGEEAAQPSDLPPHQ